MKTEIRSFEVRLEAAAEGQGPGSLVGTLMHYGQRAGDRPERFEPDSLHWPADGVVLRQMHDRSQPLARFQPKVEGELVKVDIHMPKTQRAADAVELVKSKVLRGLSVEFFPERERMDGSMRVIEKARLVGAGLVDDPSYTGSAVSVRDRSPRGSAPRYYV